ncbi:hypothetical protein SAMN05216257_10487 [Meinhardsimonia xiamenensis]|jgi:hypothetical protein|uniref:Acyl-CoA transferase n=1 Tax=Meinhardsimonia xiamenensis TaxID=990712 RepID=A0A1G9DZF2_9RHOB|nr:acyl-CoA transferase [Meinhardsimonia xiamenensis]PRX29006.1 hypothetical protein LV81_02950 [Meinhardsimonia xiamenensis]SDK69236.1 hypothetical protein SAMN05216257_10487 [Meinhardsimonia xiamenensis]
MRKSEQVLQALAAVIEAGLPAGAAFRRGGSLPARVPAGGLVILRDGDPGEPEVLLSPPTYVYQHRAQLEVLADGSNREAVFDSLCAAIGVALAGDRTLGGVCDWAEPEAPAPEELSEDGGEGMKAAVVPVVLHYATGDPLE